MKHFPTVDGEIYVFLSLAKSSKVWLICIKHCGTDSSLSGCMCHNNKVKHEHVSF